MRFRSALAAFLPIAATLLLACGALAQANVYVILFDPPPGPTFPELPATIQRVFDAGSGPALGAETIATGLPGWLLPNAIGADLAVDQDAGVVFWHSRDSIYRVNLDGTEVVVVKGPETGDVNDLVIEPASQRLFWTSPGNGIIRSNYSGTDQVQIQDTSTNLPAFLAINSDATAIFWNEADLSTSAQLQRVKESTLSGSDTRIVFDTGTVHITPDLAAGTLLYWLAGSQILRATPLGTEVATILDRGTAYTTDIEVDAANDHLYWAEETYVENVLDSTLYRASRDGSNVEAVASWEGRFLRGIALAPLTDQPSGVCGNAVLDAGEECDDGNLIAGDGCSPACETEEPSVDVTPELALGAIQSSSRKGALGALFSGDGRQLAVVGGKRDKSGRIKRVKWLLLSFPLEGSWIEVSFDRKARPKRIQDSSGLRVKFSRWSKNNNTVHLKTWHPGGGKTKQIISISPDFFTEFEALRDYLKAPNARARADATLSPRGSGLLNSTRLTDLQKTLVAVTSIGLDGLGMWAAAAGVGAVAAAGAAPALVVGSALVAGGSVILGVDSTIRVLTGSGPLGSLIAAKLGIADDIVGMAETGFGLRDLLSDVPLRGPLPATGATPWGAMVTLMESAFQSAVEHYKLGLDECRAVTCNAGFAPDGAGCLCTQESCGDGQIVGSENCDDGNNASDDGCSSACSVEDGWSCRGEPSACTGPDCGNGNPFDAGEGCDDGNNQDGDGCNAICLVEDGWTCAGTPSVCTHDGGGGELLCGGEPQQCVDVSGQPYPYVFCVGGCFNNDCVFFPSSCDCLAECEAYRN